MFVQGGQVKVFLVTRPVNFRKGSEEGQKTVRWTVFPTNGLALALQEMFGLDPFCGAVFVFRSKRADRIKLLVWDQTGMVLVHKRLEDGKFVCGCGEMARIGEDVSERLDVIPAQFRVLVTRRPKYACRRCSQAVAQAHAPEHVVPGGLPTELFIAVCHRARTDGATMAHHRLEVRGSSAVLPSGRDLQTAGDRSGLGYARQMGWSCLLFPPYAGHQPDAGPFAPRGPHLRPLLSYE